MRYASRWVDSIDQFLKILKSTWQRYFTRGATLRWEWFVERWVMTTRTMRLIVGREESEGEWWEGQCVVWGTCLLAAFTGTKLLYCLVTEITGCAKVNASPSSDAQPWVSITKGKPGLCYTVPLPWRRPLIIPVFQRYDNEWLQWCVIMKFTSN